MYGQPVDHLYDNGEYIKPDMTDYEELITGAEKKLCQKLFHGPEILVKKFEDFENKLHTQRDHRLIEGRQIQGYFP